MELYNVYERRGSGGNGLNRLNTKPVTQHEAERIVGIFQESRANRFSRQEIKYLIVPYRKPRGYITNSVSTY